MNGFVNKHEINYKLNCNNKKISHNILNDFYRICKGLWQWVIHYTNIMLDIVCFEFDDVLEV